MNFQKYSLTAKILFALAVISGGALILHSLPINQKENNRKELHLFQQAIPCSGLNELLTAFGLAQSPLQALVDATQKEWLRTAGKERWEAEDPYANRKAELMPLFIKVGVVDEIKPSEKEYDYVLIMGALFNRAQLRLNYAIKLWNEGYRFKEIVLLGSERKLDATQEPASAFGQGPTPQTEYEMMRWVYEHADLPADMKNVKMNIINTPNTVDANGQVKRATTADTIKEWLKTNPNPGSCLIVSNQPHVGYQAAVVESYLPDTFKVVPVGDAINPKARVCEILDALARWIYQENELLKKSKIA